MMMAHTAQEPFLANEGNKLRFIALVTKALRNAGYKVSQAVEDDATDMWKEPFNLLRWEMGRLNYTTSTLG